MKLKKGFKRFIIVLLVIALAILGIIVYKNYFPKESEVKEIKIVNSVKEYGYELKENKSKKYKKLFTELKEILQKDPVKEEEYVKKISEMFITDFYSLNDKITKSDVGGVDFLYSSVVENFLLNAEDTYYKYLESNLYNNRKQSLPEVDEVTIEEVTNSPFNLADHVDEKAYVVKVKWTYTETEFSNYQSNATLVFVHDNNKLCLVELQ